MPYGETTSSEVERAAAEIVDAAYRVHLALGPGLLESVYEACLAYELTKRGLKVRRQVPVPIRYEDVQLDEGFRADLLLEDLVVVEIKSVLEMNPVFYEQTKTHVQLLGLELGLLINFNVSLIKDGIKRVIKSKRRR